MKRSSRVTAAFRKAFPEDRPWRLDGVGGPVRIRGVSATIGDPGWINVRWMPFGDADSAECAALPPTFEGEEVNYICERTTLLAPEERAAEEYTAKYLFSQAVGVIEGSDGASVRLVFLGLSRVGERVKNDVTAYGGTPGEVAILADWVPVPRRKRKSAPVMFPSTFEGYPVYYRRGSVAVAY